MSLLTQKNPFTGDVIETFTLDSIDQVNQKITSLCQSQLKWKQTPLQTRIEGVKNAMRYFEVNKQKISEDICEAIGRPLHQCFGEIRGFFERAEYLCSEASLALADDVFGDKPGFERKITHEPLGTIFVISAWNYPLLITVNSVIPALISGNTVLLKHSSLTPTIGRHFEKAFANINGIEPLLLQTVCTHETTGKIIENSPIDHVIFTGSVHGGQKITQHCAKRFFHPTLELGGKDAAYIHKDADVAAAAASVVDGAMFNSGHSCCGIERAYAHEDIYDSFIQECQKLIQAYQLGDPKNENTNLGPLAQAKSADFLQQQIAEACNSGAKVLCGGQIQHIQKGTFWSPTLVVDVDHSMGIMKEENFAPILPVMKVENENEAIRLINDCDYGLTTALFTRDPILARKWATQINTGTVFMNRCDYLDPALPWAGRKNSGIGSSLSKYSYKNLTRTKSIHFKL